MKLNGIDHITGITADGQRCLDFYAGILGLAFLGRDEDFEAPGSHLIRLGHQPGRPGGALSFIEAPGVGRGRPGNGMAHLIRWAFASLQRWTTGRNGSRRQASRFTRSGQAMSAVSGSRIPRASRTSSRSRKRSMTPASRPARARSRMSTRSRGSPASGRMAGPGCPAPTSWPGDSASASPARTVRHRQRRAELRLRLRRAAARTRPGGRRDDPPHRLGDGWVPTGMAPAGDRNGMRGDAGDRPRRLPIDLLPRALRSSLRDLRAERRAKRGVRRDADPNPADLAQGRSEGHAGPLG